jgi:hypothetical protein
LRTAGKVSTAQSQRLLHLQAGVQLEKGQGKDANLLQKTSGDQLDTFLCCGVSADTLLISSEQVNFVVICGLPLSTTQYVGVNFGFFAQHESASNQIDKYLTLHLFSSAALSNPYCFTVVKGSVRELTKKMNSNDRQMRTARTRCSGVGKPDCRGGAKPLREKKPTLPEAKKLAKKKRPEEATETQRKLETAAKKSRHHISKVRSQPSGEAAKPLCTW